MGGRVPQNPPKPAREREREREYVHQEGTAAAPVEKDLMSLFFIYIFHVVCHYGHKLLKFLIPRSFRTTQPLLINKYLNPRLTPHPPNTTTL